MTLNLKPTSCDLPALLRAPAMTDPAVLPTAKRMVLDEAAATIERLLAEVATLTAAAMTAAAPEPMERGDEADLRRMMRDPRYWRDRDPEFVRKVTDGFRRLVGYPGNAAHG